MKNTNFKHFFTIMPIRLFARIRENKRPRAPYPRQLGLRIRFGAGGSFNEGGN